MRVRIIKTPPAPLMDGFNVQNLFADQVHDVDGATANYLFVAGYAVRVGDISSADLTRAASGEGQEDDRRPADARFREELHDARAKVLGPGSPAD